jgi:hypothetical protein
MKKCVERRDLLLVIGAGVLRRIFKDVSRAGGKAAMREDAHLDIWRADLGEGREATGSKVRPGGEEAVDGHAKA